MNKFVSTLALLILILSIASPLLTTTQAAQAANEELWREKFHPAFLVKITGMRDDDVVTALIRLKPLPEHYRAQIKGHYRLVIDTLKWWAKTTQAPVVKYIIDNGGMVLNTFWIDNVILVKARVGLLKKLALRSDVVEIFENYKLYIPEPIAKKKVAYTSDVESWGIFKIRAPDVWADFGITGQGVRIALVDTGVDISHEALAGKMLTIDPNDPHYPGGWMEFDDDGNPVLSEPWDSYGHGTHTSGTALGGNMEDILIGVAPEATLMHAMAFHGPSATFAACLAAVQWTIDPFYIDPDTGEQIPTGIPAHVVSMSWGAADYYGNDFLPTFESMLLANIIPVAAIGNEGEGSTSNPGNIWGVFGVGATDQNDNVAYWSSGGVVDWPDPPEEWPFYDYYPSTYIKPDFSAPGVGITSSVPGGGYEAWDGTSMATPHVSGTVALILQAAGWLYYSEPDTPEKVYEILMATAVDLGDPGQDTRYGWGRIDAYNAVQEALKYAKKTGVEGYVYDAETGEPITWATVTVSETGQTVTVNGSGYFKIPLDPGTYHLIFEAWGYETQVIEVTVTAGNGTIAGVVLDEITGLPIEGAGVTVEELGKTVYTNATGGFSITVPAGTYTVTAWKEGYENETQTVTVGENETVILVFTLVPSGNGTIVGYVVDNETGQPIAGAAVWTDTGIYNFTDENGFYMLTVPAGVYTVYAMAPGYAMENVSDVQVNVGETVWVNFSLSPIPPVVVVIGNSYIYNPHIAQIIASELGYPVVEYDDAETFLQDWGSGAVQPKVIIIDHWDMYGGTPDLEVVTALLGTADAMGVPIVFLGTAYSGKTGLDVLYYYNDQLELLGYPAPDDYIYHYPAPEHVLVYMLDPTHPVFEGVVPDNDSYFYLADLNASSWADYRMYFFEDDDQFNITVLAVINDTYYDESGGVGVAVWYSTLSGAPWFYLGSWAESSWMKYLEPGSDGMYSNNTMRVLVNAVEIAYNYQPGGVLKTLPKIFLEHTARKHVGIEKNVEAKGYTYVEVYLERKPYGWVQGHVEGSDGTVLAGAEVVVLGTPVKVETDENGDFYFWLPAGDYTLIISYPGYETAILNITVTAGETTDLDTIVLERIPRIAILYDYRGEIKSFLEYMGFYAADYNDINEMIADLSTGFYDLAIWAGHTAAPMPSEDEFWSFVDTVESLGLSVIWLDNWGWGSEGYGINALYTYMGDPAERHTSWGAAVFVKITQAHPIFRGYQVGDVIQITTDMSGDYSWFGGFSGEVIGRIVINGEEIGDMIGWKMTESGAKWILMAAMAPEPYTDMYEWTMDAFQIFLNAVYWALTKPLNLVLENPYLHVGETAVLHISGAPANAMLYVLLDGELITATMADENGNATVSFTVPLIPGGTHTVEAVTEDGMYYGMTELYVLPEIVIEPTETTSPGLVHITATGLPAYMPIYIYLDGNYLSFLNTNKSGALETDINIPLVVSGVHKLRLIDAYTGDILAEANLLLTQSLEQISEISDELSQVVEQLSEVTGVLTSITDDIATIKTNTEEIKAKIDELNATLVDLILTETGEIYALLETSYGTVVAKLDTLEQLGIEVKNATNDVKTTLDNIAGVITSISNDVAVIKTDTGEIKTRITDLNASLIGFIGDKFAALDTTLGTVIAKVDDLKSLGITINTTLTDKVVPKLDEILSKLNSLNSTVSSLSEQRLPAVEQKADEAKSTASTASAVGYTASGLAVVALIAALVGFIRRR